MEIISDVIASDDTEAFCFYAKGPEVGLLGLSEGRASMNFESEKEAQQYLLAYHLFELQDKYSGDASQIMKNSIEIYNENKEDWRERFDNFRE